MRIPEFSSAFLLSILRVLWDSVLRGYFDILTIAGSDEYFSKGPKETGGRARNRGYVVKRLHLNNMSSVFLFSEFSGHPIQGNVYCLSIPPRELNVKVPSLP